LWGKFTGQSKALIPRWIGKKPPGSSVHAQHANNRTFISKIGLPDVRSWLTTLSQKWVPVFGIVP
jgi:hypothetical protein